MIYPEFLCGTALYKPGCEERNLFSAPRLFTDTQDTHRGLQGMTEMAPKLFCRAICREILMIPFCPLKLHLNRKKQKCQYLERWFSWSTAVFYPGSLLALHPSRPKSCLAVLPFVTLQLHGSVSVGEAGNTSPLSALSCWVLFQLFTDRGFTWKQHQCIPLVVIYWVNCPQWLIQYIPERKYQNHSLRNTMGMGCVHSKCNWTEELIGFDKCWPIFFSSERAGISFSLFILLIAREAPGTKLFLRFQRPFHARFLPVGWDFFFAAPSEWVAHSLLLLFCSFWVKYLDGLAMGAATLTLLL